MTAGANPSREPEIADLCDFLCGMGAVIEGAGSSTIHIEGGHTLHGVDHEVIADRIEAGTYLIMGAATGGVISAGATMFSKSLAGASSVFSKTTVVSQVNQGEAAPGPPAKPAPPQEAVAARSGAAR